MGFAMSGIVNGINYALLFSGESASTATASILSTLYSSTASATTPATTFVSSGNPVTDLKVAQQEETTAVAQEAAQPEVARAIDAFKSAVASATSIQAALGNPAVQQVLLTANGLSSYIGQTALVQKILLSDPSDSASLVNQLGNPTWLSTVETYKFGQNGLAELQNPAVISALSNAYAEVEWRTGLDQATPGLSNALAFLSQASSIKSAYDVLGNDTNFQVITTALGIPQTIVYQDQSTQVSQIDAHLDYSKLQDRTYVTSLTDQYLLLMQQQSKPAADSVNLLGSLIA
jgi:hypothetical protein